MNVGPHHTFSVWLSLYTNYISSAYSPCFFSVESNLRFTEKTCLNPQAIPCFWISHRKTQVWSYSSHPPSTIFPQFFPVMSRFHEVLSVEQGLLLIFIWCSGETIAFIEVVFVMPPWRELHSTSSYFLQLGIFIFSLGKLCNSFWHASKTTNVSWHELSFFIGDYIHTHITGASLTLNMQTSTFFFSQNFC